MKKLALAISVAASMGAYAQEELDLLDLQAVSELSEEVVYINGTPSLAANLTDEERRIIDGKREAIINYLFEVQELSALREALAESQRQGQVRTAMRAQSPLTPEEILALRMTLRDRARAENAPLEKAPTLEMRTVDLDIEGQQPIELRVTRGYSSSIVFFDETGAPWPLQTGIDALGDSTAFSARTVSEQGHVATFQIIKDFAQSNALVILEGLPVPVVLRLVGSSDVVDSRLSIRIPRPGPNAKVQVVYNNELDNAPAVLLDFMNGKNPAGAVPMKLNGIPGEVVRAGRSLYVRTRANLMNPLPVRSLISPSGYNIYEMSLGTHFLFTLAGEMREVTVEHMPMPNIGEPVDYFAEGEF